MQKVAALVLALAAAACCAPGLAFADPATEPTTPPAPRPARCTAEASRPADILDLTRSGSADHGRCVTVEGLWIGRSIYKDLDAYYLDHVQRMVHATEEGPPEDPGHIGVYASDRIWDRRTPMGDFARAVVHGRMGDCQDLYSPDTLMVTGYCHTDGGAFIQPDEARFERTVLRRLVSDADRVRVGDLAVGDASWRGYEQAKALMRTWIHAFVDDDKDALADLRDVPQDGLAELKNEQLATLRADKKLRRLYEKLGPDPEIEAFVYKETGAASFDPAIKGWDEFSIACVCLVSSCQGLWPINQRDAGDQPGRPYRCMSVYGGSEYRSRKDGHWSIEGLTLASSLAEPSPSSAP